MARLVVSVNMRPHLFGEGEQRSVRVCGLCWVPSKVESWGAILGDGAEKQESRQAPV